MTNSTKQVDFLPEGVRPAAWSVIACIFAVVAGVLFTLTRCSRPAPVPRSSDTPAPAVSAAAIASSSAQAVGTQAIRVMIRRRSLRGQVATLRESNSLIPGYSPGSEVATPADDLGNEEIIIDASQSVVAQSNSIASASVVKDSFTTPNHPKLLESSHGRIGVIAALVPGVAAVDLEAFKLDLPSGWVGVPLEVGLDVEANHLQAGAGVSVGNKAYALAGAFTTWSGEQRGVLLGAGLRF